MAAEKKLPGYLKKAHKESVKRGWTWDYRGSHHMTVRDADGNFVASLSLTAYDGTLTKVVKSKLRKAGCPAL
jgi:hypothetical protein